tara:strand:- start:61 stop:567 length:507 start_codon:yes stop_codon:yes gene_type:complete
MDPTQPIQKTKRVLSEDALAKLAVARIKAIEARKHNCAVRREAKAQSSQPIIPPTQPVATPVVSESVEPTAVFPPSPVRIPKPKTPARRRQKIVLYSDSDSDDEAVYIKTKRKKRKSPQRSPLRRPPPQRHPSPVDEPPVVQPSAVQPSAVQAPPSQPQIVVPHWMKF